MSTGRSAARLDCRAASAEKKAAALQAQQDVLREGGERIEQINTNAQEHLKDGVQSAHLRPQPVQ